MRRIVAFGVGLLICIVAWLLWRGPLLDGCYDTSIVGYISENAYIKFSGTNVFLVDGENPPVAYGQIAFARSNATWTVGVTKWYLQPTWTTMVCTEVGNETNRFVLNWVPWNPAIIVVDRVYRSVNSN